MGLTGLPGNSSPDLFPDVIDIQHLISSVGRVGPLGPGINAVIPLVPALELKKEQAMGGFSGNAGVGAVRNGARGTVCISKLVTYFQNSARIVQ